MRSIEAAEGGDQVPQEAHYGDSQTFGVYLYPQARGGLGNDDYARARRELQQRLREAGFSDFAIVNGGQIPGGVWAMEVHFRGQRDEIWPDLPQDLVRPE